MMTVTYEIKMPLPPTLNEIINSARCGWQSSNQLKKRWTNKIAGFVKKCDLELSDRIWVEFNWYLRNFGRDADNVSASSKFIMDALVDAKVIRSDNLTVIQSPVVHYYHRYNKDIVILRLSQSPDFLLDNFLSTNKFSPNKIERELANNQHE